MFLQLRLLLSLVVVVFLAAAAAADGQSTSTAAATTSLDINGTTGVPASPPTATTTVLPSGDAAGTSSPVPKKTPRQQPQPRFVEDPSWLCSGTGDSGSSVGRHLGCSCVSLDTGGLLEADCSSSWIGPSTTPPPPYLNISVYVRLLDLSGNELEGIRSETFGECDSVFSLNLMNNVINDISGLGECKFLQKVDLSWNRLTRLDDATFGSSLSRLRELDLSFNNITEVSGGAFRELVSLRRLVLASNPLGNELMYGDEYTLELGGLTQLEELDLSNCSFPDFPLYLVNGSSGGLKKLILKNNEISALSEGLLHQLGHLEVLDLSGNWFQTIQGGAFVGLTSLRSLRLDKMPYLQEIQAHAFAGLIELKELYCQKNHFLHHIDSMAFRVPEEEGSSGGGVTTELGECVPKVVKLGDNNLGWFEYGLLEWGRLEALELHRNPWVCDCNLQWVAEFYRKRPAEAAILTDSDFNCTSPHIFAGVPVVRVDPDEMLCGSPWAPVAGGVGIFLFGFLLFTFCSVIILNHMGILPEWVRRYNVFGSGSSLPKYMRVNPKPTRARRSCLNTGGSGDPPYPGDLEWDSSDVGGGGGGVDSVVTTVTRH